jgi:fucose permease
MRSNKIINLFFGLSLVLLFIAAWVGGLGLPKEAGGPLIISFNKADNQARLIGGWGTFFALWGVVAFITAINFLLARAVYRREKFMSYITAAATAVITFLFLIAAVTIAAIN